MTGHVISGGGEVGQFHKTLDLEVARATRMPDLPVTGSASYLSSAFLGL